MKRKIAVVMILVLLLSVCVGALAGCDEIIKRNEDRDMNQVVASVQYNGQTSQVYKYELVMSFNSYAYIYHNYYQMSYESIADYLLQSLAQRELLVLFAKDELVRVLNEKDGGNRSAASLSVADLLSTSELSRAIDNVNEDILTAIDSALESRINIGNNSSSTGGGQDAEYEEYTGSDAITIRFDAQGGSEVSKQRIKDGTTAFEPTAPTREGYTFYGWYTDKDCTEGNKFDFSANVELLKDGKKSLTLYAKWVEYLEPRPVRPAEEEDADADYDPDVDIPESEMSVPVMGSDGKLSPEFRERIKNGEEELDCLASYSEEKKESYLAQYLDLAVADVKEDFDSLYTSYDYYLLNEQKSLLITRLERVIGSSATVNENEVKARFDTMVGKNKEAFADDSSYEDALTDALATTYYHKYTAADERYGFVTNILLKMSDDDLAVLTEMVNDGIYNDKDKKVVTEKRNELLRAMTVNVSNPDYDPEYVCDKHSCEAGSGCDPMTCPDHTCNSEKPAKEDYNNLLSFNYNEEKGAFEIVYNVTVCPSMAYLPDEVPAFGSSDGTVKGIVEQIYESFEAVTKAVNDGNLKHVESVYWIRELATAWLYLVGDDAGGTSSDSNNGGLGYLVAPESADTDISYIDAFNTQARGLIEKGTGAYSVSDGVDGSYVFGDSFIQSGSTSNAYAGIFILVATYVPYDESAWTVTYDDEGNATGERQLTAEDFEGGVLPLDYIVEYGATLDDCVTIGDALEESILNSKKSALYEEKVNAFGVANYQNISYNKKAYKSLWEDLD